MGLITRHRRARFQSLDGCAQHVTTSRKHHGSVRRREFRAHPRKLVGMISRPMVEPVDCLARFSTGAIGDSTKISLVDLFGLGEFAWLAFRYHPALG